MNEYILPTNKLIAREGVDAFRKVITKLPWNIAKDLVHDPRAWSCFLGICPEVGGHSSPFLTNFTDNDLLIISNVLQIVSPDFVILFPTDKIQSSSFINLLAVEHVILNHPNVFSAEALKDPRTWIVSQRLEWLSKHFSDGESKKNIHDPDIQVKDIRFGLLSGYPLAAVMLYRKSKHVIRKLEKMIPPREALQEMAAHPYAQVYIAKAVLEPLSEMDPGEKELLLREHFIHIDELIYAFAGYNLKKDTEFKDKLTKIYDGSNIKSVAKQLASNLRPTFMDRIKYAFRII